MTKEIALTQGKVAIVDDEDYEWLMQWKWTYNTEGYAVRYAHIPTAERAGNKRQRAISMHHAILPTPLGKLTDHKDRNGLNNQKSNLRVATYSQNIANQTKRRIQSTSKFIGVYFNRQRGKWAATINANGNRQFLGYHDQEIDAAKARDNAARDLWGEFAVLNFPEEPNT